MRTLKKELNFSDREIEVLSLVKEGYTSKQIGKMLVMAEDTVEGHRRSMLKKAGAKNMIVVVYVAAGRGII